MERLYPLFEAKETFLFVLGKKSEPGEVHLRDAIDSKRLMSMVINALIPVLIFGMYNVGRQYYQAAGELESISIIGCILKGAWFGPSDPLKGVIPILLTSYAVGGVWELLFAVVRKHEINEGFLVTGMLLPLVLPPTIPLWMVAVGVSFGVVIGKEVFGGTGMNVFNPALTARAFLFFAYPAYMSGDKAWSIRPENMVDNYSGATPLAVAFNHAEDPSKTGDVVGSFAEHSSAFINDYTWWDMFIGTIPGSIGETSTLLCILGAGLLIATGVGSWRIMLSTFLGAIAMTAVMNIFAPSADSLLALPPHYHIVMGGFAFGLVYMATDPVSAAQTNIGKWIYGFLIGVIVIIVRVINPAYPEGMMLSILFMNAFAPLVDYYVLQAHIARRTSRVKQAA